MTDTSGAAVPVPADKVVSVTLELQHWNVVVGVLSDGPYKLVQPLIDAIRMQVMQQIQPQPAQPIQGVMPNGADYSSREKGAPVEGLRPAGERDGQGGEGTGKLPD